MLKINVFFSVGESEKSICLTTTGCGCLFKFSNLYNQFTNEYISITPVNSHVFLMQESVLFGLSLFFLPQESVPHEEECVGVVRMNDFQAVKTLWPHVP